MSFEISGYVFEGPYSIPQDIEQESGVYLVLGLTEDHKTIVVEVGHQTIFKMLLKHM